LSELSAAASDLDNAGLCLYEMHSGNKYTLRTPSLAIRDTWFSRLQELISANRQRKDSRKRSSSEPAEPMTRSPAIQKRSVFRQVSRKTKHAQLEGVLSNPGSVVATDDIEVT